MIYIDCPHCGNRPVAEFSYGEVFDVPESITDPVARDFDRSFMLNNTEGVQVEAWFHTYGCRRWHYMKRDTRTNQFIKD